MKESTIVALLAITLAVGAVGCGPPRMAPDNLSVTTSLRTAISTRRAEWLEQNVSLIEERKAAGEMSQVEYEALQAIIAQAKAGQWDAAERAVVRLQKAQRPTPEQIGRLPKVES